MFKKMLIKIEILKLVIIILYKIDYNYKYIFLIYKIFCKKSLKIY